MLEIKLKVKGKEITLTPEELKKLRGEIDAVLGARPASPYQPLAPSPSWPPFPKEGGWPRITFGDRTGSGDFIPDPNVVIC